LGFPTIYGREFTILFLKEKLKEFGLDKRVKMVVVEPKEEVKLGSFIARFIPVTHAIPQSSSIQLKSPVGTVVYTGDYKFDDAPVREQKPDYAEFERIGKEGVDLACMDSTNVFEAGKAKSETEVARILDKIVKNARGRVIAATFSSLGTRLYSFVEIAKKYDRKIVITGRSMKTMIQLMRNIGYVKLDDNILVDESKIKGIPDEKLLILTTGTQGEEMAALSRMSRGEHRGIRIKDTDTVILSSSVIPGNQGPVQHLIDDLLRLGARVIHQSFMAVHASGHGYQDDMKKMFELLQPKYVMPVHGWRSFIHEAIYLLGKWGMDKGKTLHPETGQRFEYDHNNKKWSKGKKFSCRDVYVDGISVGETDAKIIADRKQMLEGGIVWVIINVDKKGARIKSPIVGMRGLASASSRRELVREIQENARNLLASHRGRGPEEVANAVRKNVYKTVLKKVGKEPLVVVEVV
jgi:ribonuclease J